MRRISLWSAAVMLVLGTTSFANEQTCHELNKMPALIIISVDLDENGKEIGAVATPVQDFDRKVLDDATADEALYAMDPKQSVSLDVEDKQRQSSLPEHMQEYFNEQDSFGDEEWIRRGRFGIGFNIGPIGFGLYSYGNRGHYGYGYPNYRRSHYGRYGYYNNYYRYPYRNWNYYRRGTNRNHYFYYNPWRRWR